jgi:hypothetical protein
MCRLVRVSPYRKIGMSVLRKADLLHEGAQFGDGLVRLVGGEIVVVHRQDEAGCPALLLGEGGQVAVTGHPEDFHALVFQGLGQGADAQAGGVLGTEVFVDDDDGEAEAHDPLLRNGAWMG